MRVTGAEPRRLVEFLLLLGRVHEAVEHALAHTHFRQEAFTLAQRLRESHPLGAFKLVYHALSDLSESKHNKSKLVFWLVMHAHECDAYMRGGAVSSELTLSNAPQEEGDETPIVFTAPAGKLFTTTTQKG